jgi:phenylacetate-CoA ligase
LGYACPRGDGAYHQLSPDVYLEAIDAEGRPVADGQRGEITVSGGRNPFLPLLRYRTGDHGCIDRTPCPCGDPMPRLIDVEGRAPVLFRAGDGRTVNPVDISRLLRDLPLVQHELVQRRDRSLELTARAIAGAVLDEEPLRAGVRALFGDEVPLSVVIDPTLGDKKKPIPYSSEMLFDE